MTARARHYAAEVLARQQLSPHLVRLVLGGDGLREFRSTGVPDEWVALVVPGQFQSRFYTVRAWDGTHLVLDVVLHATGLVTDWAATDCVGDVVTVSEPKGSFVLPPGSGWVRAVGDLTALPALARIAEWWADGHAPAGTRLEIWAEAPGPRRGYFPEAVTPRWLPWREGNSLLADSVTAADWPEGPGYFWMAGESAQMRALRRHLSRDRGLPSTAYDVMGYWRAVARRRPRAVDPGPIWRAGKAAGKSDEQIWADYDAAASEDG